MTTALQRVALPMISGSLGLAPGVNRTLVEKLLDSISVKDFGATGNGTTDDTAAIQAAFDWAVTRGAEVHFPAGTYRVTSQLLIDGSAATSEDAKRVDVTGDGAGCTVILSDVADGPTLFFRGSDYNANGAYHSFQRLANIRIQGTSVQRRSIAVYGQNLPYFAVENVVILYCEEGLRLGDVLSSIFSNVIVRGCLRGFSASRTSTPAADFESDPNNVGFFNCTISSCAHYGYYFQGGANVGFFGGSIENNGMASGWDANIASLHGAQPASRWGLKMDGAGAEGAVGISAHNVYFEGNQGQADVWIDQPDGGYSTGCAYVFTGCTFHRLDSVVYTTNNIRIDSANTPVSLSVNGCGFRSLPPYAPDGARQCIQLSYGKNCIADQGGNFFSHTVDKPLWSKTPTFTAFLNNDQTIPNDSPQLLAFNKSEDYGNCWDDTTHAFVAPTNIRMRFCGQVHFGGSLASGNYVRIELRVNNNVARNLSMAATGAMSFPINAELNLQKNDTVQIVAYVNSGGADRTVFSGPSFTFFTGSPA